LKHPLLVLEFPAAHFGTELGVAGEVIRVHEGVLLSVRLMHVGRVWCTRLVEEEATPVSWMILLHESVAPYDPKDEKRLVLVEKQTEMKKLRKMRGHRSCAVYIQELVE